MLHACVWLIGSGTAAVAQRPALAVRDGTSPAVAIAAVDDAIALESLARALGARITLAGDGAIFAMGSATLRFRDASRFVRAGERVVVLPSAARRDRGRWLVDRAVATDLLPRLVGGLLFDAEAGELRRFAAGAPARPVASGRAESAPDPQPAPPRARVSEPTGPAPRSLSRRHVVVVDAGHGGKDPGMRGPIGGGPQIREKDITLQVSQRLRDALTARGVAVVMTRTSDTLIALADRGKIANQAKGDLFVSIHVNAANLRWKEPGAARGYETYFLAEAKTEDERRVAAMENEVVKFETEAETSTDDPLGFLLRDMAQNEHLRESSELASEVQARLGTVHPAGSRGVKQAGFRVLVGAFMPAVLVEIGFGTNAGDAAWMSSPTRQGELASALADAVLTYLERYDRKVGAPAAADR
ncbi:MAG: N-acetylmuramoyl-L-alanine amidase [Gemmatimonadaceae bacterium]|jgi:N-acetylmuramoyl-L-alanine amidase|nr:N-acetylmuramoyl-L-alanine amidase [Gemmatimonadaceae bacterium]